MLTCNNIHGIVSQVKSGQGFGFSGECVPAVGGSSPRLKPAILFVINLFAPERGKSKLRGDNEYEKHHFEDHRGYSLAGGLWLSTRAGRWWRTCSALLPQTMPVSKLIWPIGDTNMKSTILVIIVALLLLVACGSSPMLADGGGEPVPLCYPKPCQSVN